MNLKDIHFKPVYNSTTDNILDEFYIPGLSSAKKYKRVSAYFDSNILSYYSRGIEQIVSKNGHIFFIFSHQLNENDFNLIKEGYKEREKIDQQVKNILTIPENPGNEIKNLGYLIKHNYVDIKIAFTRENGVFHDKFGLIEDGEDVVYFRGSNNETVASIFSNYESFETTRSWLADSNELIKIENATATFDSLWNNTFSDEVIVLDMPKVIKDEIISYAEEKIIITNVPKQNSFILDYDNGLIGYNRLHNPILLSPQLNFYKRELEAFVTEIIREKYLFYKDLRYTTINEVITALTYHSVKYDFELFITPSLRKFLYDSDIQIEKRRSLGVAIKTRNPILHDDVSKFQIIIEQEMERELREPQLWGSYHLAKMRRGANFSVPGSGKTSIVYGAFAYLSSKQINEVDKIVMIGPINSFSSWEKEFVACFGNKRKLRVFNYQKKKRFELRHMHDEIVYRSGNANLFLFNYESMGSILDSLERIIDNRTLLVFDEVHRIKNIVGKRAGEAKIICQKAKYRAVLTGTPIPNGYVDIFNMLNILFTDEYDDFFGFQENYLLAAKEDEFKRNTINNAIFPFFCRTNKEELNVPPAEPDDITSGYCVVTTEEEELFKIIYLNFRKNILLLYIRLMQAATNPKLVLQSVEREVQGMFGLNIGDDQPFLDEEDYKFINKFDMTSKFWKGIDIVTEKVKNGPVIVWGIFVDTLKRIEKELNKRGIKSKVISGAVPIYEREKIITQFREGEIKVLITNPHTLGESISLHDVCHQAVYFEYGFNLVHMLQSRDRIHRLGLTEKDKTEYTYMILDNPGEIFTPIDEKIYQRLKDKEKLQSRALSSKDIYILIDNLEDDIKAVLDR